jgi:hypothetical protein
MGKKIQSRKALGKKKAIGTGHQATAQERKDELSTFIAQPSRTISTR